MQVKNRFPLHVFLVGVIILLFLVSNSLSANNNSDIKISIINKNSFEPVLDEEIPLEGKSLPPGFGSGTTLDSNIDIRVGYGWDALEVVEPDSPINDLKMVVDNNDNVHIFWSAYVSGSYYLNHKIRFASNDSWSNKMILGNTASTTEGTIDVKKDSLNRIHLVWEYNGYIKYKYYNNGLWSNSITIHSGFNPNLGIDSNNDPHILFIGSGIYYTLYYYYARYSSITETWHIETINFGYTSFEAKNHDFDIIKDGEDKPLFFSCIVKELGSYYDPTDYLFYQALIKPSPTEAFENDNFYIQTETTFNLNYLSKPNLLVQSGGKVHLFVNYPNAENDFRIMYQMRNESGIWGNYLELSNKSANRCELSSAVDTQGKIVVVWNNYTEIPGGVVAGIYMKFYSPITETWSDDQLLTPNFNYSQIPSIDFDSEGNLHLIYYDKGDSSQPIYYRKGWIDSDQDGLMNFEENAGFYYPSNPVANATGYIFTDPYDPDTDDDQMTDWEEVTNYRHDSIYFDPLIWDEENDGMADGYEFHYGLDWMIDDSILDFDIDNLTNIEEYTLGTYPNTNDSDIDDVYDWYEVTVYLTNPMNSDTDGDYVPDGVEINDLNSNPLLTDTDSDTMDDYYEWIYNLDINNNDTDQDPDFDGLINLYEYQWELNPQDPDNDDDNLNDGQEVLTYYTDPKNNDTDDDLLLDGYEVYTSGTDPTLWDTDGDLLDDKTEWEGITDPLDPDSDDDLMYDGYEVLFDLNPNDPSDAHEDPDEDTLDNLVEYGLWTNPHSSDTDGDRISDADEVKLGSNPILADTDGDGLDDYAEIYVTKTDFDNPDTDVDGVSDYAEVYFYHSNPNLVDTDGDGLTDGDEVYIYFSDPTKTDSDEDGLDDNIELDFNSSPIMRDTDLDGMDDFFEWSYSFDPNFNDAREDFDNDGVINLDEFIHHANPLINDTDGDNLSDYQEIFVFYTLAYTNDTDEDTLSDYDEIMIYNTSPNDPDHDDDGLLDGIEVTLGTDPTNPDTDGDGVLDGREVRDGTDPLDPKDNRVLTQLRTLSIIFTSILGGILIYYTAPFLIAKMTRQEESKWVLQGILWRKNKSSQIIENSSADSNANGLLDPSEEKNKK
ncbi:MAG TPA: hypothetical protein VMX55_14830 [candidate division Zixibacteria bacterium]|nr:hypothetical protein [candidate division Zixibacteria bacterium]